MPSYKNILLRAVNRIGDGVFSMPAIRALRDEYPQSRITVLTKPGVAELYVHNPAVNDVMLFEDRRRHKGLPGRLRLIRELRTRNFDLAVIFHNCFDAALVPFLAGIPERIGYVKEGRGFLLTRKLPFPAEVIYQVDHYLDLVSLLGFKPKRSMPELTVSDTERAFAERLFREKSIRRPAICLVPGSIAATRRWPPERFAELADKLSGHTGGSIIVVGGRGDEAISGKITGLAGNKPVDLTGRIGLRELMAVLSLSDLVVSNDTGPMHLAWTLGTPVVTFLGAADPRGTGPSGEHVRVIRKEMACSPCIKEKCPEGTIACLDLITVDEVFEAARESLARYFHPVE